MNSGLFNMTADIYFSSVKPPGLQLLWQDVIYYKDNRKYNPH